MAAAPEDRNLTQVVIGLAILAFGVIFVLDNVGAIDAGDYLRYWPLTLIGLGIVQIVQATNWSGYVGAVIWLLAGLWFLGRNIGLVRVSLDDLWPLIVVGIGVLLVFRGWRGYGPRRSQDAAGTGPADPFDASRIDDDGWVTPVATPGPLPTEPAVPPSGRAELPPSTHGSGVTGGTGSRPVDHVVSAFVVMGGITRQLLTQDFRGGTVMAVMGGAKIDLRQASIAQREAAIDVLAFWGGIEIKVPEDWVIVPQVFPFMGGFEDKTGPRPAGSHKRLVVRGLAFMGGVEVKH